jgi:hypothetical protein
MTATDTPNTDDVTAVPPAQPFAFEAQLLQFVDKLLQLRDAIRNDELFEGRVKELRAREAAAEKAERSAARREIAAGNDMRKEREALERREADVTKRELAVFAREGRLDAAEKVVAEQKRLYELRSGRFEVMANGMSREFCEGYPTGREGEGDDALYPRRPAREAEPESELERVPGSGHSLTRSIPKKRGRPMRRGAEV